MVWLDIGIILLNELGENKILLQKNLICNCRAAVAQLLTLDAKVVHLIPSNA